MHPVIKTFLTEYSKWVSDGAPIHMIFNRCDPLCDQLQIFMDARNVSGRKAIDAKFIAMLPGKKAYPFGGIKTYHYEHRHHLTHENPHRIAWVRKTLRENP